MTDIVENKSYVCCNKRQSQKDIHKAFLYNKSEFQDFQRMRFLFIQNKKQSQGEEKDIHKAFLCNKSEFQDFQRMRFQVIQNYICDLFKAMGSKSRFTEISKSLVTFLSLPSDHIFATLVNF